MFKRLSVCFAIITLLAGSVVNAAEVEKNHRFKGYFINGADKYPVCISVFEHFVVPRGIVALSGYMEYATHFFNDVPMDPPSFSVVGNFSYDQHLIFSVFDRNNTSPDNVDLFLRTTDMSIAGDGWEKLAIKQGGKDYPLTLTRLKDDEACTLKKISQ